MKLLPDETFAHLRRSWSWRYQIRLEDAIPTETPGYWRKVKPCGGWADGCRAPLHTYLWNDAPTHHTLDYYDDNRDDRGRFASPYRTWKLAREAFLRGRWPS